MEEIALANEPAKARESGKPAALPGWRAIAVALAVAVIAVCWFMFLSNWLGVKPGTPLTTQQNVLFDSDSAMWIDQMIGNTRSLAQTIHPLELLFWRYPCRALAHLAGLFMPRPYASLFGVRLLVSLFAGSGVGFLAYLAMYLGVPPLQGILLFGSYLLFSINTTVVIPEHYGISNGLLTIAFVVFIVVANERLRNGALAVLAVLCGGTSILNVLFPVYCLFESVFKSPRLKLYLRILAVPVGIGSAVLLYHISYTVHWYFYSWMYLRILHDPQQAFVYMVYLLAAPAVGAKPFLKNPQWPMVTYDHVEAYNKLGKPLDFSYYHNIQGIGAILWLLLLARCIQVGFRDTQTRPYVKMALVWVLFSLIFFNIWGREPFLYSSAWSWALMALVLFGARRLSRTFIAAMVVPIAICQVVALHDIGSLLQTVNH